MKLKNNLLDGVEYETDGHYYAVNLWLKSGQRIYLEDLPKGEKDAYVSFVRDGGETMLLQNSETLWRIRPEDVERVDVKMYGETTQKSVYPLLRIFLAKSRMATETFGNIIRLYLVVMMVVVLAGIVKAFRDGALMGILFDKVIMAEYAGTMINWMEAGFLVVFSIMVVANLADFAMKPLESYHVIDPERHFLYGTKTAHLLMTIAFAIGFILLKSALLFGLSLLM